MLPSPEEFFGFAPGRDGRMADWAGLQAYLRLLAASSPRLRLLELGTSTEGRPLIALVSGPTAALADLDALAGGRQRRAAGTDPGQGRLAVAVVIAGTHAAETAAAQGMPALAFALAGDADAELERASRSVLCLLVPAVDPDGLDRVCAWLARRPWRPPAPGSVAPPPPGLCRRYAGHDLNRDWIMQTQPEVRAVVQGCLHRFVPQVVLDLHEMWPDGPRMFLPPYADPADPSVHPAVRARTGLLGANMAARMGAQGFRGIVTGAVFDAYSPARGYPHHHGAVRILCEVAGAGAAAATDVPRELLRATRGFDPQRASPLHPQPWPGGRWSSADVMRYQRSAVCTCLGLLAADAANWVQWQDALLAAMRDAGSRRGAYFLPAAQSDPAAADELLRVLRDGGLRVEPAPGGWSVPRAQPYGSWADALLAPQPYPGPVRTAPYDVTAHLLPALMGVHCGRQEAPGPAPAPRTPPAGARGGALWPAADSASYARAFAALVAGETVWRIPPRVGATAAGGAFARAPSLAHLPEAWRAGATALRLPLVAVYGSWRACDDEGWLRWVLDRFGVPFLLVRDHDIRRGDLRGCTHLVLPSLAGRDISHGLPADRYPDPWRGGLGEAGRRAVAGWTAAGGCLLAVERAAAWAQAALGLSARDVTLQSRLLPRGALLTVQPGRGPLALGAARHSCVMYRDGPAFAVPAAQAAARFTGHAAAGLAAGAESLAGAAALAQFRHGRGRCCLYAFSPYFRAQAWAGFRWLFNALLE